MEFQKYLDILPNVLIAFAVSVIIVPFLRKIGLKYGFYTKPKEELDPNSRNYITVHHKGRLSRLGEFGMVVPLLLFLWIDLNLTTQVLGIVLSVFFVSVLGIFDSKYNLNEFVKLYLLICTGVIIVFTGTVIDFHSIINLKEYDFFINNPLTQEQLSLFSSLLTIGWIVVVPYALSLVGGVDGLSEGTSLICILILTLIGIRNGDPLTITIGALCLGGLLGVLPYNFPPAIIISEHLIYGLIIGILAITSQAKVATSILILTIPLIDFIYVHYIRTRKYFKENEKFELRRLLHYLGTGDRNHFHHKLMELGLTAKQISLLQYAMYGTLGLIALFVTGLYLTIAVVGSISVIVLIFYVIHKKITNGLRETKTT